MKSSELDYELPRELIAQHPAERRDASRLLVYDRRTNDVRHRTFAQLPDELHGELVVVNDTKVVPARLLVRRESGGEAEVLLLESLGDGIWEALARPSRRLRAGERLGPRSRSWRRRPRASRRRFPPRSRGPSRTAFARRCSRSAATSPRSAA